MAELDVLAYIDAKIAKLQQARALLSAAEEPVKAGRGRPKGSKNAVPAQEKAASQKGKRTLSPEGRKAIADAMKRRWAEKRKQAK